MQVDSVPQRMAVDGAEAGVDVGVPVREKHCCVNGGLLFRLLIPAGRYSLVGYYWVID